MKVLLVNGSPRAHGCTYTALCEVAKALEEEGIETEIFQKSPCRIASPAASAGKRANASLTTRRASSPKRRKRPTVSCSARPCTTRTPRGRFCPFSTAPSMRAGRRSPASRARPSYRRAGAYWNMVYGNTPEEVKQDLEGMQTMRNLGRNMAYLIKCIDAGKKAGIQPPRNRIAVPNQFHPLKKGRAAIWLPWLPKIKNKRSPATLCCGAPVSPINCQTFFSAYNIPRLSQKKASFGSFNSKI